jgi:hypothetical protein
LSLLAVVALVHQTEVAVAQVVLERALVFL